MRVFATVFLTVFFSLSGIIFNWYTWYRPLSLYAFLFSVHQTGESLLFTFSSLIMFPVLAALTTVQLFLTVRHRHGLRPAAILAIALILCLAAGSMSIATASPSPSINLVGEAGNLGPCKGFVYNDGSTPVFHSMVSLGGNPAGLNTVGSFNQTMDTFLPPILTPIVNTGGGTICFDRGTYYFSASLNIVGSGVYFYGLGFQRANSQGFDYGANNPVRFLWSAPGPTASGSVFLQWGEGVTGHDYLGGGLTGIYVNGEGNVEACLIDNNVHDFHVEDSAIMDCGNASSWYDGYSGGVELDFVSNVGGGISDMKVEDSLFGGDIFPCPDPSNGIFLTGTTGQMWITQNYFTCMTGIGVNDGSDTNVGDHIEFNHFESIGWQYNVPNSGIGIEINQAESDTVVGNTFNSGNLAANGPSLYCILLASSADTSVTGNSCINPGANNGGPNPSACWSIQGTASVASFTGNNCKDYNRNMNYGFYDGDTLANGNNTIVGDSIAGWKTAPIGFSPNANPTSVRFNGVQGIDPVGAISSPFNTGWHTLGLDGNATNPTSGTVYTCVVTDCYVNSTGGTGTQIFIYTPLGVLITSASSPPTTLSFYEIPYGYEIRWTFSEAPTVNDYAD
jgi:hypothetical protein